MKWSDVTIENMKAFFEGNIKLLGDRFNMLPEHTQEQVAMRAEICKTSCLEPGSEEFGAGRCEHCGCSIPSKWYATKSCNKGDKFPDLMDKKEWEEYKKKLEDAKE